jgi:hypothetical protein
MNREWHENVHHLMNVIIGMPPLGGGERNHRGFDNPTTDDSWGEEWAAFWSCALSDTLELSPHPENYIINGQQISLEHNWQVWDREPRFLSWPISISREDFAVASLLWDLFDHKTSIDNDNIDLSLNTLWSVIGQIEPNNSLNDMRDVYDVLQQANLTNEDGSQVNKDESGDIDEVFIAQGLERKNMFHCIVSEWSNFTPPFFVCKNERFASLPCF